MNSEHDEIEGERDWIEPGAVIGSRYRVEVLEREHRLGELYRCRDEAGGGRVLIQRLRREFGEPEVFEALLDSRCGAALGLAGVVDLLDYGVDIDERVYLVMAWDGQSKMLSELLGSSSVAGKYALFHQVVEACAGLHAIGLIHGAIEVELVRVRRRARGPGRAELLGFGLLPALLDAPRIAEAGPVGLLNPACACPELLRGSRPSAAADVYMLGVIGWSLFFGGPPFGTGEDECLRTFDAHLHRELPALEGPSCYDPELIALLRRMLAKSPAQRPAHAGEVLDVLDSIDAPRVPRASAPEPDSEAVDSTRVWVRAGSSAMPALVPFGEAPAEPAKTGRRWGRGRVAVTLAAAATIVLVSVGALSSALSSSRAATLRPGAISAHASARQLSEVEKAQRARAAEPVVEAEVEPTPGAPAIATPEVEEPQAEQAEPSELVESLGATEFRAVKGELYGRVGRRCNPQHHRRTVRLSVRVDPEGSVDRARVRGGMARSALGRCVRREAAELSFPSSETGGRYTYTLRLR